MDDDDDGSSELCDSLRFAESSSGAENQPEDIHPKFSHRNWLSSNYATPRSANAISGDQSKKQSYKNSRQQSSRYSLDLGKNHRRVSPQ